MASYIIAKIDFRLLDMAKDIETLNRIPKIQEEYDEFAQGYWKNISLMNASGSPDDTQLRHCEEALPTKHLDQCPMLLSLIQENFCTKRLVMVRARSLIDGMVIPHRDFVEFQSSKENFFRVFMMLEDNPHAYHSDESGVFQMRKGEVWFLDVESDHAAVNFSDQSRMAICLDFMLENDFNPQNIFKHEKSVKEVTPTYKKRHRIDEQEKRKIVSSIAGMLSRETFKDMIFAASKLNFHYDIPVSICYDWVIEAASSSEDYRLSHKAISLKKYLTEKRDFGERFSISNWQGI